jgi:hypothetical protein
MTKRTSRRIGGPRPNPEVEGVYHVRNLGRAAERPGITGPDSSGVSTGDEVLRQRQHQHQQGQDPDREQNTTV